VERVSEAANGFAQRGYAVVRELIPESLHTFLYEYVLKLAQTGRLNTNDSEVPNTPGSYSDVLMDTLLELTLPRMEVESGLRLFPTYSYFRVYKYGDVLKRHQDRPSCEVSATLNLGYKAAEPWPIWIETGGIAKGISLEAGDAMLYKGIDVPHWREKFAGEHSAQVFLHYVDQNGPHKDRKFDGRKGLTTSAEISHLLQQLMGVSGE
jgi:hypothetical protein